MHVQFAVHQQHVIPLRFRALDIGVVRVGVVGIEQNEVAVLVRLRLFHLLFVLLEGGVFAVEVLQKRKIFRFLVEFLVGQHAELDKHLDVVPFLGKLLLVRLVEFHQFVGYFLGDIAADFLDVIVALEVTAADIQRYIRAVYHAVQQRQVLRHDILHLVGHIDLIAIELNLVAVHVHVALDAREIEDSGQVERVVHIQMDMEERLLHLVRIELVVELVVVLVGQVRRLARPRGVHIVDDILLVQFHLLAVFPLFLLAESDLHRQELAVFLKQPFDRCVLQIAAELVVYMEHDVRSALGFDGLLHRIFRIALAAPVNRLRVLPVTE